MKILKAADLFCGAGGTSTGLIEAAKSHGYNVELTAIDHWSTAIETHKANHPEMHHLCTGIDAVDPRTLYSSGELDILWASPSCTHFSVARGGVPVNDQQRATPWCVVKWADALLPNVIFVENVPEFRNWGPIGANGQPLKSKKGKTFMAWLGALRALGYRVDYKILRACDYGDPTSRRRLFIQAVRGNRKLSWPEATHGRPGELNYGLKPWKTARDIINWSLQGRSIFDRKKPLSPKTLKRIEIGLHKYGFKEFMLPQQQGGRAVYGVDEPVSAITTKSCERVVQPFIIAIDHKSNISSGISSQDAPLSVVTSKARHTVCEPYLIRFNGTSTAEDLSKPLSTVAGVPKHYLCEPFLIEYYGQGGAKSVDVPLGVVTTKERFGLVRPTVTINGASYKLDIKMRMLEPRELARAQGFNEDYKFSGSKTDVVKQIGNAVPRRLARALVNAALN